MRRGRISPPPIILTSTDHPSAAVAFFDTSFTQTQCSHFYLFEPIATAFLVSACSIVHVIRVHAIYDKSRTVLLSLSGLFALQVVCMAIACGFYRSVPLEEGQGCIAGPKHNWVGIYWLAPTLLYTASFALAVHRSLKTLDQKPLSYWKLMLRDGLNLYAAIWGVNMVNMLFWFIAKPTGTADSIKTIVTSMAAVLTTTMTLRIILGVRGTLSYGGSFAGASSNGASGASRSAHNNPQQPATHTHAISTRHTTGQPGAMHITSTLGGVGVTSGVGQTYTISEMPLDAKRGGMRGDEWDADGKSSVNEGKEAGLVPSDEHVNVVDPHGVKITIDRQVD